MGARPWPHRASSEQITAVWPASCCCQHLSVQTQHLCRVPNTSPLYRPPASSWSSQPPEAESPPRSRQNEGEKWRCCRLAPLGDQEELAGQQREASTQRKKEARVGTACSVWAVRRQRGGLCCGVGSSPPPPARSQERAHPSKDAPSPFPRCSHARLTPTLPPGSVLAVP